MKNHARIIKVHSKLWRVPGDTGYALESRKSLHNQPSRCTRHFRYVAKDQRYVAIQKSGEKVAVTGEPVDPADD